MKHKSSYKIWFFILAVYLFSAILWIPIVISGKGMASQLNTVLMALITFVPSIMGILFTYLVKKPVERSDFSGDVHLDGQKASYPMYWRVC